MKRFWHSIRILCTDSTQHGQATYSPRTLDCGQLEDRVLLSASPIGAELVGGSAPQTVDCPLEADMAPTAEDPGSELPVLYAKIEDPAPQQREVKGPIEFDGPVDHNIRMDTGLVESGVADPAAGAGTFPSVSDDGTGLPVLRVTIEDPAPKLPALQTTIDDPATEQPALQISINDPAPEQRDVKHPIEVDVSVEHNIRLDGGRVEVVSGSSVDVDPPGSAGDGNDNHERPRLQTTIEDPAPEPREMKGPIEVDVPVEDNQRMDGQRVPPAEVNPTADADELTSPSDDPSGLPQLQTTIEDPAPTHREVKGPIEFSVPVEHNVPMIGGGLEPGTADPAVAGVPFPSPGDDASWLPLLGTTIEEFMPEGRDVKGPIAFFGPLEHNIRMDGGRLELAFVDPAEEADPFPSSAVDGSGLPLLQIRIEDPAPRQRR